MHSVKLEGWPENFIERKILKEILDHKIKYPINSLEIIISNSPPVSKPCPYMVRCSLFALQNLLEGLTKCILI